MLEGWKIINYTELFLDIKKRIKEEKLGVRIGQDAPKQYASGKEAEARVSSILRNSFPNMLLIDDAYFDLSEYYKDENGYFATMQIDHILVSEHAVYVIETKKYSEDAELWGSSLAKKWNYKDKNVKCTSRENGNEQNKYHIRNLRKILNVTDDTKVISIVCLVGIKSTNIKIGIGYGEYVFTIDEMPIMIDALDKININNYIDKDRVYRSIQSLIIKACDIEISHIIYVKLLQKRINTKKFKKFKKRG